jgi:hypothetical protein
MFRKIFSRRVNRRLLLPRSEDFARKIFGLERMMEIKIAFPLRAMCSKYLRNRRTKRRRARRKSSPPALVKCKVDAAPNSKNIPPPFC